MFRRSERGFTLIELLVVIAILGIISGIAVPRVLFARDNANRNANIANRAILQSAVERHQIDHGTWPVTGGALPGTGVNAILDSTLLVNYLSGGVLPRVVAVDMNPGVAGGDVAADNRWAINSNGFVLLVGSADTTTTWGFGATP